MGVREKKREGEVDVYLCFARVRASERKRERLNNYCYIILVSKSVILKRPGIFQKYHRLILLIASGTHI